MLGLFVLWWVLFCFVVNYVVLIYDCLFRDWCVVGCWVFWWFGVCAFTLFVAVYGL